MKVQTRLLNGVQLVAAVILAEDQLQETVIMSDNAQKMIVRRFVYINRYGRHCKLSQAAAVFDFKIGREYPEISADQAVFIMTRDFIEVSPWNTKPDASRSPYPYKALDWRARTLQQVSCDGEGMVGPTLIVAAMRCHVEARLGALVELPNELR